MIVNRNRFNHFALSMLYWHMFMIWSFKHGKYMYVFLFIGQQNSTDWSIFDNRRWPRWRHYRWYELRVSHSPNETTGSRHHFIIRRHRAYATLKHLLAKKWPKWRLERLNFSGYSIFHWSIQSMQICMIITNILIKQ